MAILAENLLAVRILGKMHWETFLTIFDFVLSKGKFEVAKIFVSEFPEKLSRDWLRKAMEAAVLWENFNFLKFLGESIYDDGLSYLLAFVPAFYKALEKGQSSVVERLSGPEFFEDVFQNRNFSKEEVKRVRSEMLK